jgi:uncharacterized protein YbjT (DUF2867 family)
MPADETSRRRVMLAGATGLVGREVLQLLVADPGVAEVTALVRRSFDRPAGARTRIAVVDFDRLDAHVSLFAVDQIICAMGTTIAKAGSQDAFRRVDFTYPLRLAELGIAAGVHHFLLVSAIGASAASRVFYSRVKGQLEERIRSLGFRSFTIARPSLLVGERDVPRRAEVIGSKLSFLTPPKWKPVHARQVAAALVHAAQVDVPGTRIMENSQLRTFPR